VASRWGVGAKDADDSVVRHSLCRREPATVRLLFARAQPKRDDACSVGQERTGRIQGDVHFELRRCDHA